MDTSLRDESECFSVVDDDAQSYMDEDDVREVRLHHWLSETASARLMQDSALTRADSPLLGFDHLALQGREVDSANKPLPELPSSISRLRSHSAASSTVAHLPVSRPALLAAPAAPIQHRRSPSQNSAHTSSPALSRRPSLARKPSLPLLSESVPLPSGPALESTRLHSIASSLSIGPNRNAVYIDSEQVSSRLDEWLTSGNPGIEQIDDEIQSVSDYYATSFDRPQDSSVMVSTPAYAQGPPPNTPLTTYFKTPLASSSQIYLGKGAGPTAHANDEAPVLDTVVGSYQEDIRATPVPHGKLVGPDLAVSCSTPASDSSHNSPLFSATTSSTSPTSAEVSSTSIVATELLPQALSSKPSLASLSKGVLSPKPSASSIGLAYQTHGLTSDLLSPPPPTASRWSLTSSIADDAEKDKKKERGGTRKRLVSFISKLAGHSPNKEAKENSEAPVLKPNEVYVRGRSISNASFHENALPLPVKMKSKSKPPSLKLDASSQLASNICSPTFPSRPSLSSTTTPLSPSKSSVATSTPTATNPSSMVASPISPSFTPVSPISPIKNSFASTRLSVSTSMTTTSTNNASPLMPTTPVLTDAPLLSPTLKSAVSVPVLSPTYDGPGLIRRDNSYGANMNNGYFGEHIPLSRSKTYVDDDEDLEADAEYYTREFSVTRQDPAEEERKARLSVITDMLDRDLNAAPHPNGGTAPEPPCRDSLFYRRKEKVQVDVVETLSHNSRTSPVHFRKSSSASRTSSPVQRRSVSGPHPISPNVSTPPPLPSKSGFRNFAARMGISNSLSTPHSLASPEPDSKRKSLASLMPNGKRKGAKRRLVISGVGDGQGEVAALKEWCSSLGEVRSMMKVKNFEGAVAEVGQKQGVWVVDFKKSSVAENVCQLQAKVEIKGAGSVRLSWETAKPKLSFNVGRMGWIP